LAANLISTMCDGGTMPGSAPTVTAVTFSPASGDLGTGATVTVTLDMSAPVTVSGVPALSLDDGGTATYDAAQSTATALAFTYTVAAGQETHALGVAGVCYPDRASIDGTGGTRADLHDAFIGQSGATGPEIGGPNAASSGGTAGSGSGSSGSSDAQAAGSGTYYTFAPGTDATLSISGTTMPTGNIVGFVPGDTIDLTSLAFAAGDSAILTAGNVLAVAEGGKVYDLNLDPNRNYSGDVFDISSDGGSGTDIAVRPATFQIDISYDSSVTSLKTSNATLYNEFTTGVAQAVQYLESLFTNQVTVTLDIGYGELDGQPLGSGDLGENEDTEDLPEGYAAARTALLAENAPGSSTLPTTSPYRGTLNMTPAEALALGLQTNDGSLDGYAGFATQSNAPFSYALGVTPSANDYYFVGVVEHELTEEMGRISELDEQPSGYMLMDLYRYASSGARDTTTGRHGSNSTADFSINNGTTLLGSWNNVDSNGDLGDWYPQGPAPGGNDSFNDESSPGVINVLGSVDDTLMQALGWEVPTTANQTPLPLPNNLAGNGVSDTLMTNSSGAVVLDEMSGGAMTYQQIGGLGPEWQFEGMGPLLGDGNNQFLLWYGTNDSAAYGAVVAAEDDGGTTTYTQIGSIGPEWQFEGVGALAGGSSADFLLWDGISASPGYGALVVGAVANGTVSYAQIGAVGPEWKFEGVGPYLGNGSTDFLIWDTSKSSGAYGSVVVGQDVGGSAQYTLVGGLDPTAWVFEGSGDLLNDGKDSVLIWNQKTGALAVGEVNGSALQYTAIGGVGPEWQFLGTGNYDGQSSGEFLMFNTNSGALVLGTIAGGLASYAQAGGVGPTQWTFHPTNSALIS
jgi:hypothetical protein